MIKNEIHEIYNKISPDVKKLIKEEFTDKSFVDSSLIDIIYAADLMANGFKLSNGTIKKFDYKEIDEIYTGNKRIIFDEIYNILKDTKK